LKNKNKKETLKIKGHIMNSLEEEKGFMIDIQEQEGVMK